MTPNKTPIKETLKSLCLIFVRSTSYIHSLECVQHKCESSLCNVWEYVEKKAFAEENVTYNNLIASGSHLEK